MILKKYGMITKKLFLQIMILHKQKKIIFNLWKTKLMINRKLYKKLTKF